jgi:hypothetical protein
MKAFALGLIVGAVVCFAVVRLTDLGARRTPSPDNFQSTRSHPVAFRAGERSSCTDPGPATSVPSLHAGTLSTESRTPAVSSAKDERSPLQRSPSASTAVEKKRMSIEDLNEKEASEVCQRAHNLQQEREQAAKDAEPKDAGWAFSMEQLIRQHVESHLPPDQYSVLKVECRTTFCQLELKGRSQEGRDLADKVASTIPNQLWSDIAPMGQSGGSDGTTWHIQYEWYRPRTESERRLWLRNRDQL